MFNTRYILLSIFFIATILFSYILFYFGQYDYSYIFLVFLSLLSFLVLLRLYKFYHDILRLLKKDNVYIKNTVISFFTNPNKEFLRYKYALKKKISILEKDLALEKKNYAQLLNSIPLPLALINEQRYILHANKSAKSIFSLSFEGSYLHQYFRDPILKNTIKKINETFNDETFNLQTELNNRTVLFNVKMQPVLSEEKKILYYLIIFIDQDKVSKSIQERNDFLANASHELKTPLTNILGISEILSNNPNSLLENKSFGKNLFLNVKRMQSLINSLLDLSKVEINKNIIDYKSYQLYSLTNAIIEEYKNSNPENYNIKVLNNLQSKELSFKTDKKELSLLFFNLLDNSFKYGASLVEIFLEKQNQNVIVIFHDDGKGIPKNEINRVTERFYRVKGNEKIEGNGLGLAIAQEVMNNHSGEIKIQSEKEKGTKISLIF